MEVHSSNRASGVHLLFLQGDFCQSGKNITPSFFKNGYDYLWQYRRISFSSYCYQQNQKNRIICGEKRR